MIINSVSLGKALHPKQSYAMMKTTFITVIQSPKEY